MITNTKSKSEQERETFWWEYEERYGEKVLASSMGRCLSGWPEFTKPLWGLVIATSGGFRFHHFSQPRPFSAIFRYAAGGDVPKDRTAFIPKENILSAEYKRETTFLKRLLIPFPWLVITYRNTAGGTAKLIAETDKHGQEVAEKLQSSV